ncbi:MAG: EAL domain-containing protein [Wenzhouxiangella sp.]|nr:EAL domain-containing protein [Wenzhouxiangella sp.]
MNNDKFLAALKAEYQAFTRPDCSHASAMLCLSVDHWQDLREDFGYSGLLRLRGRLARVCRSGLESLVAMTSLTPTTLVLLVRGSDIDALRGTCRELFDQINQTAFPLGDDSVAITLSAGFCPFDLRFQNSERMLVETVARVEGLQQHGGNDLQEVGVKISAAQASDDSRRMLSLLMQALHDDGLKVVFQPLLATHAGQTPGFQMLPRLAADDGELISAGEFLPVAHSAGLVGTLDRWMIARSLTELARRKGERTIRLLISQSDELLTSARRREQLANQLLSSGHLGGHLVLDFRLSDAMTHLSGAEELLEVARGGGVQICLSMVDEHSNWTLLAGRLRVDYLRMAPKFVQRLSKRNDLAAELDALTAEVRALGTRIIMPMIEDSQVAAHLWRAHIDYLQGNAIQTAQESLDLVD